MSTIYTDTNTPADHLLAHNIAAAVFADRLTTGQEVFIRDAARDSLTMSSGTLRLTYFTSRKTETVTQAKVYTANTAAGATPTLIRIGLYTEAGNGDLTLVASTPNDTSLLSGANAEYAKSFSASYGLVLGSRYAIGLIVVTAAAAPTVVGNTFGGIVNGAMPNRAPRLVSVFTGQTDLPSSITNANQAATFNRLYAEILP